MIAAAAGALIASALAAYLIGHAFVAPRDSFLRSKRGVWLLIVLGLSFVSLPPQVLALDSAAGPLAGALTGLVGGGLVQDPAGAGVASAVAWPQGWNKGLYLATWFATSLLAFLAGIRIWRAGSPDWREGDRLYDASAASRVNSLMPMADSLEDALDTIGRAHLALRDMPGVAEDVRGAGRRFSHEIPPKDGDLYALVARRMPGEIASRVTGFLLEGAGRRHVR